MGGGKEILYPDAVVCTAGHVDHGKTTLIHTLTGIWVAKHSEELKRAMTIKLGYVTLNIYECPSAEDDYRFVSDGLLVNGKCPNNDVPKFIRKISILDVPGHEVLISTMISGVSFVDAALMIIDASMPCPQPQTEEHFIALSIIGLRNMIVIQNKLDLVSKDKALENYRQIKKFLQGTWAENSLIIPASALHKVNIEVVSSMIHKQVPPRRVEISKNPKMYVLRSFNTNRPGTPPEKIVGGVLGGVLTEGELRVGDEIEIRPGLRIKGKCIPIRTEITSITVSNEFVNIAKPGALVGIGTKLDPALTKADSLSGSIVSRSGTLPPVWSEIELNFHKIKRGDEELTPFKQNDAVMINVGSSTTAGIVKSFRKDILELILRKPICAEENSKIVITKQIGTRWKIVGYGVLKGGKTILE